MSGHNKWSTIKHRKGAQDKKRGKVFTRLIKELTVAARMGGGDPDGNPRLRSAVSAARAANMPKDNIERAIKKGTGELEGVDYSEVTYEGYGPEGIALMVDAVTDNTNRTVSEVRSLFTKRGGNMANPGAVAWMFEQKGRVQVDKEGVGFDTVFEHALEAGADDVLDEGDDWGVMCAREDLYTVSESLEAAGVAVKEATLVRTPANTVAIESVDAARKVLKLVDAMEDLDDVQMVWGNFDLSDEVLAALEED
jgi:YebC/PmpR family DNA-binding regulatory protein